MGLRILSYAFLTAALLRSSGEVDARSSADTGSPRTLTVRNLEASSYLLVDSLATRSSRLTVLFSFSREIIFSLRATISFSFRSQMALVSMRIARMWSRRWSSVPPDPGPLVLLTVEERRLSMSERVLKMLESVDLLRTEGGDEVDGGVR